MGGTLTAVCVNSDDCYCKQARRTVRGGTDLSQEQTGRRVDLAAHNPFPGHILNEPGAIDEVLSVGVQLHTSEQAELMKSQFMSTCRPSWIKRLLATARAGNCKVF